ncbi:MAG: DEAD/DEAH box helicase family protein [Kiritimatiellae bacterium]|jgi:type I restriction enzyme R subunit|nr:DEAD/DEAH box helicase family protein [Kiritimatiellia bacterium]
MPGNQNPEQIARDKIDAMLHDAGWAVQSIKAVDLSASRGVAIREYQTDIGPVDYALFVDHAPVGVIEAKREEEGQKLTSHEDQAEFYAKSKLKYLNNAELPFVYESTGTLTHFTDKRDPKPRAREVFNFHRPETLAEWFGQSNSLRTRLLSLPVLNNEGLRKAQFNAINNLEESFKHNRPKALIQMATGAGKTFTACTFAYRLLKHADAKRILFLVDTKNLGEQAEQEFFKYQPTDDNRKFTELYNVQRLTSNYIASDNQVCISTIQRIYSILQGKELDDSAENENPNESAIQWQKKEPMPVEYSAQNPIEQFDFIVIDECHRSIYNLWKQMLDYYDAFLIGLTATPDKRTFGFFNENVVSEYTYEESVTDGVNVPYDVYTIETEITQQGAKLKAKEYVDKREKLSRKKRWEQLDEDLDYKPNQLDKDVVNPSQIRKIISTFKEALQEIFPDRFMKDGQFEVPKTLVFAKTDSHADDIIKIIREEFDESNDFCKKLTYKSDEDPKSVLNRFRNSWAPRIAVTVDMVATGTDVKPLEVLLFMRDVRSSNYFEQMKGRGTRSIDFEDLKKVSCTVKHTKTHFVVVDAVGTFKSKKTDSRPLERKRSVPLKDLLGAVTMGAVDEDLFTSLANRLIRLDKQLTENEKETFADMTDGKTLGSCARNLLRAYDPDEYEPKMQALIKAIPPADRRPDDEERCKNQAIHMLASEASKTFNGTLNGYIDNVRKVHEQVIDSINIDHLISSGWDKDAKENAANLVQEFTDYIEANKDQITALSIFYDQPYRRRELTFTMVRKLLEKIKQEKPVLAPHNVWEAYAHVDGVIGERPMSELTALIALIRRAIGIDSQLTPYSKTVDKNFQEWVFKKQAGALKFTEEQMQWLRMIKDHIVTSFHIGVDDLDFTPFDSQGGRGKMWQLFGDKMTEVMAELNEVLAA